MEAGSHNGRCGALTEEQWTEILFSGDDSQDGESYERLDDAEMWDIDDEHLDPDFTAYSESELSQSEAASGCMSPAPPPLSPQPTP